MLKPLNSLISNNFIYYMQNWTIINKYNINIDKIIEINHYFMGFFNIRLFISYFNSLNSRYSFIVIKFLKYL